MSYFITSDLTYPFLTQYTYLLLLLVLIFNDYEDQPLVKQLGYKNDT